jgi:hypothetical protein
MPTLRCPNGHESEFRNFRGNHGAGTVCPVSGCGQIRRSATAYLCNALGFFSLAGSERRYRGRCSESKGHSPGEHRRNGYRLEPA